MLVKVYSCLSVLGNILLVIRFLVNPICSRIGLSSSALVSKCLSSNVKFLLELVKYYLFRTFFRFGIFTWWIQDNVLRTFGVLIFGQSTDRFLLDIFHKRRIDCTLSGLAWLANFMLLAYIISIDCSSQHLLPILRLVVVLRRTFCSLLCPSRFNFRS